MGTWEDRFATFVNCTQELSVRVGMSMAPNRPTVAEVQEQRCVSVLASLDRLVGRVIGRLEEVLLWTDQDDSCVRAGDQWCRPT